MAETSFTVAIASMSWIDPSLFHPITLPKVDPGEPGDPMTEGVIRGETIYRFANFLEAFIKVAENNIIVGHGFTVASRMYASPSFLEIPDQPFPRLEKVELAAGHSVTFTQTVGARTQSPEVIGEGVGHFFAPALPDANLERSLKRTLEVPGRRTGLLERFARQTATRISGFPPIWTELELRIFSNGSFDGRVVRRSLFPSMDFYIQRFPAAVGTDKTLLYDRKLAYDAVPHITQWKQLGWGELRNTAGAVPNIGNPWNYEKPL